MPPVLILAVPRTLWRYRDDESIREVASFTPDCYSPRMSAANHEESIAIAKPSCGVPPAGFIDSGYIDMTLEVVPAALYGMPNVQPILADGHSSILHKKLSHDLENKAIYVATPMIVYIKQGQQIIR